MVYERPAHREKWFSPALNLDWWFLSAVYSVLYWIVYSVCYRRLKHLRAELIRESRLSRCFPCRWSLRLGCLHRAKLPRAFLRTPALRRALGVCQPDFWEIKSSCQISFLPTERTISSLPAVYLQVAVHS